MYIRSDTIDDSMRTAILSYLDSMGDLEFHLKDIMRGYNREDFISYVREFFPEVLQNIDKK